MHSRLYTRVLNQYPWMQNCTAVNSIYNTSGLVGIFASADSSRAGAGGRMGVWGVRTPGQQGDGRAGPLGSPLTTGGWAAGHTQECAGGWVGCRWGLLTWVGWVGGVCSDRHGCGNSCLYSHALHV